MGYNNPTVSKKVTNATCNLAHYDTIILVAKEMWALKRLVGINETYLAFFDTEWGGGGMVGSLSHCQM